jgi:hypothetical protein
VRAEEAARGGRRDPIDRSDRSDAVAGVSWFSTRVTLSLKPSNAAVALDCHPFPDWIEF